MISLISSVQLCNSPELAGASVKPEFGIHASPDFADLYLGKQTAQACRVIHAGTRHSALRNPIKFGDHTKVGSSMSLFRMVLHEI